MIERPGEECKRLERIMIQLRVIWLKSWHNVNMGFAWKEISIVRLADTVRFVHQEKNKPILKLQAGNHCCLLSHRFDRALKSLVFETVSDHCL